MDGFNSEPGKGLRLTPPLASHLPGTEIGKTGKTGLGDGEIFNHGLHGLTRMKEVGFVSCCVGISRVEHKDFFWGGGVGVAEGFEEERRR